MPFAALVATTMHVPDWVVERPEPVTTQFDPDFPAVPPEIVKETSPAPVPPLVVRPMVDVAVALREVFEIVRVAWLAGAAKVKVTEADEAAL